MSQYVDTGEKTFEAGGAIAQHLRVTTAAGVLAAADAATPALGTMRVASFAAGEKVAVLLATKQGTRKMVAVAAITAFADVFAAAGGKIAPTGTVLEGIALEAAAADGDVIEVMTKRRSGLSVGAATAVAATGSGQGDAAALSTGMNVVSAADGTKAVVLPAAAAAGEPVLVYNAVATNGLPIFPAASDTINGGSANAAITIEGKTLAILYPVDATNWAAQFTANT